VTAYTDAQQVAAYLGLTLTSAQVLQAGVLSDAATTWIDRYVGRTWQTVSPATDEQHVIVGDTVYLARRPVVAVTAVSTRLNIVGSTWTLLDSDEYELRDAANGRLLLMGWATHGLDIKVSYTHSGALPPADVQLAASMIAGSWLSQTLRPQTSGLDTIAVGQNDIALKFSTSRSDVPAEAVSILNAYRVVVVA